MGKPPHPSQNASAPSSIEQPDIKCHNREFYVPEVPDDYPYQMEKSKSSTNISIPFYEFRGNGPPPTDIGNPGDVYLQIGAENLTLYAKMRSGWKIWNPLPMWGSMLPPASELIAHPDSDNLKRYLWCDGYQLGWYALSGVRGKRSRMRQDGMYRTKGGLTEEPNSTVVATEVIRRMLDGQETGKVRILGRSRKRPSSSLKGGETAPRKRAKTQTHRTPIIKSDDSEDKPLSWKIKFTPCYYPGESMAQHHSNSTAPGVSKNSANAPLFKAEEIDPPDVGGIQESQRMKDLIEEKNLYLEENQRLKERVLQLTSQTNRLRDEITRRSSVDLGTSSDNFQTLAEVLNPIINGNGDTLQTLGIALKNARLETQKVRLELEKVQPEADRQHDRLNTRLSNALEEFATQGQKVSELKSHLLAAEKEIKQEQAARSLIEKKYSDLVGRVNHFKATVLN